MKKIMMINGSASPLKCGVGYYGEKLVPELSKTNEMYVLTSSGVGSKIIGATNITHIKNWRIFQLPKLVSVVKKSGVDLVHIQYPAKGYKRELGINLLPVCLRIFNPKVPVIVTLHEYHESAGLGKARNLLTVLFARKIIVSNQLDVDSLPRFVSRKTTIIPIGSNIKIYPKDESVFNHILSEAKMSSKKPTLVYFGFVNPNKGIETLVNAAANIDAQILLLTELYEDNDYHSKINTLIIEAKKRGALIQVAGFLNDEKLSQALQECLFFILPQPLPLTSKSGTAIAALEHGLPVVSKSSNEPRYNYPYIDDVNAVLLDEMNENNLAKACNELIRDSKKLNLIKLENSKLKSYFSWISIADKHNDLYSYILKQHK